MIEVQPAKSLDEGISNIIEASNQDYDRFIDNENMKQEFANSWKIQPGQKFIKLVSKGSVHSFIVKEDMYTPGGQLRFRKGDILKAASWRAPALNRARGNVFDGHYPMQWTGPLYLR